MSAYIKCILLVLCRMIFRNVEKLEVHTVILNLRSFNNFVTHSDKYSLKVLKSYLVRMLMTTLYSCTRSCNIQPLCLHLLLNNLSLKFLLLVCNDCLKCISYSVNHLTYTWSLFRSYILHTLKDICKLTLLAEH